MHFIVKSHQDAKNLCQMKKNEFLPFFAVCAFRLRVGQQVVVLMALLNRKLGQHGFKLW